MAVFVGADYVDRAAKAAFALAACKESVILPALRAYWDLESTAWKFNYASGLDKSELTVIRAGPRGSNDLVWLGSAANHAARLSSKRDVGYATFVTLRFVESVTWYEKTNSGLYVWERRRDIDGSNYVRSNCYLTDISQL